MKIDFVSDVACPWCAVGLHSLEEALRRVGPQLKVELHFQPFELNPQMPPEGEDTVEHLARKYGASPEARKSASASASGRASGTPSTRTGCCTGPGSKADSAS
jgi:predicted DsbA family dithiol-disulfide isomerase